MSPGVELALDTAMNGFYVFPCKQNKHPYTAHGLKDATTDTDAIKKWWKEHKNANIGINCGKSGLVIFDFDEIEVYNKVVKTYPEINNTYIVTTGSGGKHVYYKTPGLTIKSANGQIADYPHLDIKSDGGYVIGAGSQNDNGPYVADNNNPVMDMPSGLLALLVKNGFIKDEKKEAKEAKEAPPAPRPAPAAKATPDNAGMLSPEYWVKKYVNEATTGKRNATCNMLCVQLQANGLTESEAEYYVRDYQRQVDSASEPYTEKEALDTLGYVYAHYAKKDPVILPGKPFMTGGKGNKEFKQLPDDINDVLISEWILENFKSDITYALDDNDKGQFYIHDGTSWQQDREKLYQKFIIKAVKKMVELLTIEAGAIEPKYDEDGEPTKEYARALSRLNKSKRYMDTRNITGLWNMLKISIVMDSRKFNKNYDLLNMENCTFVISEWSARDHRAEDNIKKVMPVMYMPELSYEGSEFIREVHRSFKTPEERLYIQALLGGSLLRKPAKQDTYFWGIGDTGKTTLVKTVLKALGDTLHTGYGIMLASDAFTEAKARQTTRNDLLATKDCCLIVVDEPKTNTKQDTNTKKAYTGGSGFLVRGLYGADEQIDPSCTIIQTCNNLPHIDVTDSGQVNRVVIIPFENVISKKTNNYWDILYEKEGSLINNWLLEGLKYYKDHGLPPLPERFANATNEYIAKNNLVEKMIKEKLVLGDKLACRMTFTTFYGLLKLFCDTEGIKSDYLPGKDKILSILKSMNVEYQERVTKINGKPERKVLLGVRPKTNSEIAREEAEALNENVLESYLRNSINNLIPRPTPGSVNGAYIGDIEKDMAKLGFKVDEIRKDLMDTLHNSAIIEELPGHPNYFRIRA